MNGNHNIQIEINGESHEGLAYETTDGTLIHLPGLQIPHISSFETLFQPIPNERLSGGFIEVGEWNGHSYPYEGELLFNLGPDGAVWTKVCDYIDDLPLTRQVPSKIALAWRMLAEAEEALGVKSMARERAACGHWPSPHTIQDYLMWLQDEVSVQEQQSVDHPEEANERASYTRALRGLVDELCELGFEPATVPWAVEEGVA